MSIINKDKKLTKQTAQKIKEIKYKLQLQRPLKARKDSM